MDQRQAALTGAVVTFAFLLAACDDLQPPATARAAPPAPVRASTSAPAPAPATAAPPVVASATAVAPPPVAAPPPAAEPASSAPAAKLIETSAFADRLAAAARQRLLIRTEVLLDRAHFSPGVIDGRSGTNLKRALQAFEQTHGLAADGALSAEALAALTNADGGPVTQDYVISASDVAGPFLGTVPKNMADLAKLKAVGYATPLQALAEKFHMSEGLLRSLNPGADFGVAGTTIVAVRPGAGALAEGAARVEVDKALNQVRALDAGGRLLAVFPATVGSTERPAPDGEWAVKTVVANPNYSYDPKRLTFGDASKGAMVIPPGPNNPVGSTWIALTKETYGIHGTPDPTRIGKTASHGCVRLTNWDAAALGRMVKKGTPVVFVGIETKKS